MYNDDHFVRAGGQKERNALLFTFFVHACLNGILQSTLFLELFSIISLEEIYGTGVQRYTLFPYCHSL